MESEFEGMLKPFEVHSFLFQCCHEVTTFIQGKETEHNWAAREKAVQRVRGMLKGDAHNRYTETFLVCLKEGFIKWSLKTVSMRTS